MRVPENRKSAKMVGEKGGVRLEIFPRKYLRLRLFLFRPTTVSATRKVHEVVCFAGPNATSKFERKS